MRKIEIEQISEDQCCGPAYISRVTYWKANTVTTRSSVQPPM